MSQFDVPASEKNGKESGVWFHISTLVSRSLVTSEFPSSLHLSQILHCWSQFKEVHLNLFQARRTNVRWKEQSIKPKKQVPRNQSVLPHSIIDHAGVILGRGYRPMHICEACADPQYTWILFVSGTHTDCSLAGRRCMPLMFHS